MNWLRPDSKSQVTIEYDGYKPTRVDTVVVSTQHSPDVDQKTIREFVINKIIKSRLPPALVKGDITYHINPTGNFVVGGPHGDCGLTGRKIIVDTYGGWGRHGGGAFSGKDPTRLTAAPLDMARHVAKCIVAAGLADRCEIQLAYAIGVSQPVSVHVDTQGSGKVADERLRTRCVSCLISRLPVLSSISTCVVRSIARRQPVATSVAANLSSLGESTELASELAEAVGLAATATV